MVIAMKSASWLILMECINMYEIQVALKNLTSYISYFCV